LEFTASSPKSLEGFRKGLRKGFPPKTARAYFRILFLRGCKLTHYLDVKGGKIFQNTFLGGAN